MFPNCIANKVAETFSSFIGCHYRTGPEYDEMNRRATIITYLLAKSNLFAISSWYGICEATVAK